MTPYTENGIIYEDIDENTRRVVGYAQPGQPSGFVPPNARRVAEAEREAQRQAEADARAARSEARADRSEARASRPAPGEGLMWGPDGQSVTFIPGGVRDPSSPYYKGNGGKPMRQGDADKLSGQIDQYDLLKTSAMNFNPDFAGNSIGGELENWAQGLFGTGTPGQRDWWANFRSFDNLYRNELFGASLTEGEKQAYAATSVTPSMDPEQVRINVNRRAEIIRSSLERRADRLRAAGFNEDEIQASVGEFATDLGIDIPVAQSAPEFSVKQREDDPPAGALPQGPDRSNRADVLFGQPPSDSQNGGFVPYGAETRLERNPQWKGVNEAVKGMIVSGRPAQEIKAFMNSKGIAGDAARGVDDAINYYRKTGKQDFGVDVENIQVPMSGFDQFRNNAPQTAVGTAAATALNAGGFGIPQMLAGGEGLDYLRQQNPRSAFAGDVAGVIGGTAALGKLGGNVAGRLAPSLLGGGGKAAAGRQLATDAAYGGIYGATTEGDPLTGAGTAALGSGLGMGIGKGIQKGLQGVTDPAVQYLTQRGIPLTIGQTLGNRGVVGKTMNRLESLPVLGDMLGARRVDSLQAFEREALKDVVEPVGGNITQGGQQGLLQAQDAVSQGYRDALSGVNVSPDQQFLQEAGSAMQAGGAVPKFGDDFTYAMNQELGPLFGQTGQLDGPRIQSALQSIGKVRSGFDKNPDAMATYASNATNQMDDALSNLVGRQAPDVMPAYNNAKSAYSNLVPFQNARIGAINQDAITPAQLQRAVTNNTSKFGGKAAAASGKNLTDLMKYGQEVLPQSAPNPSGTASHLLLSAALPTALGGASYGVSDLSPTTAGLLATLAAMSTKTGQKALQKAVTSRSPALRKAGGIFGSRKAQQALGAGGAGALLSLSGN